MKKINSALLFMFLIIISSCSNELETRTIYEFESSPLEVGKIIKNEIEYEVKTKDIKVFFKVYESGLTDVVLQTDKINYSFSGEVTGGWGDKDNYGFMLTDFEETPINFSLSTKGNKVYSHQSGTFPKLSTNYVISNIDPNMFTELYDSGLRNKFYPINLRLAKEVNLDPIFKESNELMGYNPNKYWLEYFQIRDKLEKSEIKKIETDVVVKSTKKPNKVELAVNRKTKYTNNQMAGTFEGSQNIMDVTTTATILNLNKNGTFTYKDYIGSDLNGSGKGKYEIVLEIEKEKDPYGKVTGTTYYHGIKFHSESEYGIKTSIYRIIDKNLLLPLKTPHFANQEGTMNRKK